MTYPSLGNSTYTVRKGDLLTELSDGRIAVASSTNDRIVGYAGHDAGPDQVIVVIYPNGVAGAVYPPHPGGAVPSKITVPVRVQKEKKEKFERDIDLEI